MMIKSQSLHLLIFLLFVVSQGYSHIVPRAVIKEMSSRETRYHHFLWHNIRNLWNQLDSDTQKAIRRLGWAPPYPSQRFTSNGTAVPLENNLSGEDFLYMHRQMIKKVNSITPSFRVEGWESIPEPDNHEYPVPSIYHTGDPKIDEVLRTRKESSFYRVNITAKEKMFRDPDYLRGITLAQLGAQLEYTIHNWLHARWSSTSSLGYRKRDPADPLPDVDEKWDTEDYDWLFDQYSSQANPIFWKMHGWVNDRIEDWRRANCLDEIKWNGTWLGGPMASLDDLEEAGKDAGLRSLVETSGHGHVDMDMDPDVDYEAIKNMSGMELMEEVAKVVCNTGLESHFYDDVIFEEDLPDEEKTKK